MTNLTNAYHVLRELECRIEAKKQERGNILHNAAVQTFDRELAILRSRGVSISPSMERQLAYFFLLGSTSALETAHEHNMKHPTPPGQWDSLLANPSKPFNKHPTANPSTSH